MQAGKIKCVALAAPSGGGKTTLCNLLLQKYPRFALSISYTTRAPRGGEKDGVEYRFVSKADFEKLIQRGELIEWALVHENYYGTSRVFIEDQAKLGKVVLLDIDVQGVESLKKIFKEAALSIFILPPSMEELERRLRARNTESEKKVRDRLEEARNEMAHAAKFDYRVVNHTIEQSFKELCEIIERELNPC